MVSTAVQINAITSNWSATGHSLGPTQGLATNYDSSPKPTERRLREVSRKYDLLPGGGDITDSADVSSCIYTSAPVATITYRWMQMARDNQITGACCERFWR